MEFTAKQIAQFIQGSIEGNENVTINTFAKIEEGVPGAISFLSNPKYTHYIYETKSSVVLVDETLILPNPKQVNNDINSDYLKGVCKVDGERLMTLLNIEKVLEIKKHDN